MLNSNLKPNPDSTTCTMLETIENDVDITMESFENLSICEDLSLIALPENCASWTEYYSRTPSTRELDPKERYEVIMKRTSETQFMDHSQNSQRILDMDLFLEWKEKQDEMEKLRIRKKELYILIFNH